MTPTIYKDVPLPLDGKHIRLLTIDPGKLTDPLSLKLTIANLQSKEPFQTLSYVWGDANDILPITVNGIAVPVTKNLDEALRQLRPLKSWH